MSAHERRGSLSAPARSLWAFEAVQQRAGAGAESEAAAERRSKHRPCGRATNPTAVALQHSLAAVEVTDFATELDWRISTDFR